MENKMTKQMMFTFDKVGRYVFIIGTDLKQMKKLHKQLQSDKEVEVYRFEEFNNKHRIILNVDSKKEVRYLKDIYDKFNKE